MTELRVWAPAAKTVEIVTERARFPMHPDEEHDGYFRAGVPLEAGADYRFSLDGGEPLPDPRSPYQPYGVFGASRTVDLRAFGWSDRLWKGMRLSPASLIYELHVGTFSPEGTFDGVRAKLDHLVDLGVDAIELMPVAEFPGERGWGYDGVDLFAPHHGYGGPEGLARLVDACHARGLGVILDVVYNHLGPAGNFLERFGPYFTSAYVTPWGKAINFDGADSGPVRDFFCDNALYWLEHYHVDALRLDAVHAILDTSAKHILEELAERVERLGTRLGRHLSLIAESDLNDPKVVRARDAGGYGIDAQWSDDFHHSLHTLLTGERQGYYADFGALSDLATALTRGFVYGGRYSKSRKRAHGRPLGVVPLGRLLGYMQTHDQVGNRAMGDRSSALMSTGKLKIAAALIFVSPFVPMLFQGEEWGASSPFLYFTDHRDQELGRAVSEGRRREFAAFGWSPEEIPDPQAPGTFARSKLKWNEIEIARHRELFDWHKQLVRLRRKYPELLEGGQESISVRFDEAARWMVVCRRGTVCLAVNFGSETVQLGTSSVEPPLDRSWTIALASHDKSGWRGDSLVLPPESAILLTRR